MARIETFTAYPLLYTRIGVNTIPPILVGGVLLGADGEPVDFVKCKLPLAGGEDDPDRSVVNEILDEIEHAYSEGELGLMWQASIRNFSSTISLGASRRIVGSGLAAARCALEAMLENHQW